MIDYLLGLIKIDNSWYVASRYSTEGFFLLSFLLPQLLQRDPATPMIDLENVPHSGKGSGDSHPLTPLPLAQIPVWPQIKPGPWSYFATCCTLWELQPPAPDWVEENR